MKPDSITVSLENAKRLKQAGWLQEEALYFWNKSLSGKRGAGWRLSDSMRVKLSAVYSSGRWGREIIAAPTAQELLNKLPACMIHHRTDGRPYLVLHDAIWDGKSVGGHADTLADACAILWIALAEHPSSYDRT